jgi:hypothetical protein
MEIRTESFMASASVTAFGVVTMAAASAGQRRCTPWITQTAHILGVAQDNATVRYNVPVATHNGDIVSVLCNASVSGGALVGPDTGTGAIIERALAATAAVWAMPRLGIAMESGSTNSVINVLLNIENVRTT